MQPYLLVAKLGNAFENDNYAPSKLGITDNWPLDHEDLSNRYFLSSMISILVIEYRLKSFLVYCTYLIDAV